MQKIICEATENGLRIPSEYNRNKVKQLVKDGTRFFELRPRVQGSRKQQRFLEAAVIPAWGQYQYNISPTDPKQADIARTLFKQDWNYTVVTSKDGNPRRVAQSLKGKHREVLDKYMEAAPENGYPIPNNALYLKWRDEYSMLPRWSNYYDWLHFLGLDIDSMPSSEVFKKLEHDTK